MTNTPLNCVHCGKAPTVEYDIGWFVDCHDCRDGDGDSEGMYLTTPYGAARTEEAAIEAWNDAIEAGPLNCCVNACSHHGCEERLESTHHCCHTGTCAEHTPASYAELAAREPESREYDEWAESLLGNIRSWAELNEVTL